MKYVTPELKDWRVRRQVKIERRRRIRNRNLNGSRCSEVSGYVQIRMPRDITIGGEEDRIRLIKCITAIRQCVAFAKKDVLVDFTNTRFVYADGMLLLYAEISRLQRIFSNQVRFRCRLPSNLISKGNKVKDPNSIKVTEVLKQIGLLDILNNRSPIAPTRSDVINWRVACGVKSEGSKTEPMLKVIDSLLGKSVSRYFYTGLTEAMTNSHHHAYSETRGDALNIQEDFGWWMFLQIREGVLSILICDLGIGIPRSLPKTNKYWLFDMLNQAIGNKDSAAIEYATKQGSTSTDLKNRGKGLKKIIGLVGEIPHSTLGIYSNRGAYLIKESKAGTITMQRRDFSTSILGTLVYWQVKLPEDDE